MGDRTRSLQTRLAEALSGGGTPLDAAVESVRAATGVDRVCLNEFSGDSFETVAASGGHLLDVGTRLPLSASSHLIAAARCESLDCPDLERDPRLNLPVDQLVKMCGYRAGIVVPIMLNAEVLGGLVLTAREPSKDIADLLPLLENVSGMLALALSGSLKSTARPRVAILADDLVIGEGITRLIEREMQAVAINIGSSLTSAPGLKSLDLVLAPVFCAGRRIEETAAELRGAGVAAPLAVFDLHESAVGRAAAAAAGARAYLGRDELSSSTILAARLDAVLQGESNLLTTTRTAMPPTLTARESEVLLALSSGLLVKEIARDLGIALTTAQGYVQSVYQKLDVHSRAEAVAEAGTQGLLEAIRNSKRSPQN